MFLLKGTDRLYTEVLSILVKKSIEGLSQIPYHVCEIFDSAEDSYWFYNDLLKEVVDSHAPLKKGVVKTKNGTIYE